MPRPKSIEANRTVIACVRLPRPLADEVARWQRKTKARDRTAAIVALIERGLTVEESP